MPTRVEEILKQIHILFAKGETYQNSPDLVILSKTDMFALLQELNEAMYEVLDQYEATTRSKEMARLETEREASEIIAKAKIGAEDVQAGSLAYTDTMLDELSLLLDNTTQYIRSQYLEFMAAMDEKQEGLKTDRLQIQEKLKRFHDSENYLKMLEEIREAVRQIDHSLELLAPGQKDAFKAILADVWYGEMEIEQNLEMADLFFHGAQSGEGYVHPDGLIAAELFQKYEKNFLQALLRVKRYNNSLPDEYKFARMDKVEEAIEEIDPTVFGFEDRILEMDNTAVDLPEAEVRLVPSDRVRLEKRHRRGGARHKKTLKAVAPAPKVEKKDDSAKKKKRRGHRGGRNRSAKKRAQMEALAAAESDFAE